VESRASPTGIGVLPLRHSRKLLTASVRPCALLDSRKQYSVDKAINQAAFVVEKTDKKFPQTEGRQAILSAVSSGNGQKRTVHALRGR
jgi:hypothetical protein